MPLGIFPSHSEVISCHKQLKSCSKACTQKRKSTSSPRSPVGKGYREDNERLALVRRHRIRPAMHLLCILALSVKLAHSTNGVWLTVALVLASAQSLAAFASIILDMVPSIAFLFMFRSYMFRLGQLEMAHDFAHAQDLRQFDLASLKLAEHWLGVRIDRMKSRLVFGVGGSDKVALLTMAAGAWTMWNNFPTAQMEWVQQAYLMGSALLGGLAIGAMFANALIKHWSYQKELLAIAIFQLENE
jgi:hypothetical protein